VIALKRARHLGALLIVWAAWCAPPAHASTLWYNGNMDNRDFFVNQTSSLAPGGVDGRIYDNFIVPVNQQWTISGVFSNDIENPILPSTPTTASWEIRSGVSSGVGGTLVASGDGADVLTATGRTTTVFFPGSATEYTNQVNGLSVTLSAGTYWLSVAPDTNGADALGWDISSTSGASAVGSPPGNDDNSYFSSANYGLSFFSASSLEGGGTWDYSMGVVGTAVATPEPSSMALLIAASFSLPAIRFSRRKAARRAE
jgi:hypothetical protein